MVILTNYRIHATKTRTYIETEEVHPCSRCLGELRPRDTKVRKVIDADGKIYVYHLRRLKCRNCGASHVELPDFIVPHKHYTRRAIEMALNDTNSSCLAENSTINRWIKERKKLTKAETSQN